MLSDLLKRIHKRLPWNKIPLSPRIVKTNNAAFNSQKEHKFYNNYGNKASLLNSLLVSTAKYNAITFVPQNLAEQFMRLANVYFLVISLLQIFSGLNLTEKVNTAVPLACVVIFQMIKDGFEDMKLHIADRQVNRSKTQVIRDRKLQSVTWERVSDIVCVEQDEFFPADLVCLASSKPGGLCYIETSQLDREINLKIRRLLPATSQLVSVSDLGNLNSIMTCQPPNN